MTWVLVVGMLSVGMEPASVAARTFDGPAASARIERLPPVASESAIAPSPPAPGSPYSQALGTSGVMPALAVLGEAVPAPEPMSGSSGEPKTENAADELEPARWTRPSWFRPWRGSVELGLDGTSGNSETLNLRLGVDAKRKTEQHVLTLDLDYHKNTNQSQETANRLFFDGRYERLFPESPWSCFVQETTTYDEFQPWNVRVSATTGVGYELLKSEMATLMGRFGGGFSREIGGADARYVPELNFGLDWERELSKRQRVKASVEYYPDVTAFGDFRVVSKIDWEVLLDEEMNLSLKLSAADRYKRPNPGGQLNDVDYSVVLLWKY